MCKLQSRHYIGDTSIVSQSVTNNRCAPSCGGHKRKVGAHQKKFGRRFAPALYPHLQIASDATGTTSNKPKSYCDTIVRSTPSKLAAQVQRAGLLNSRPMTDDYWREKNLQMFVTSVVARHLASMPKPLTGTGCHHYSALPKDADASFGGRRRRPCMLVRSPRPSRRAARQLHLRREHTGSAAGRADPPGRQGETKACESAARQLRIFTAWPILHVFSYHLPTDLPASRLIETNCAACFSYWPAAAHLRRSDGCCGWVGPSEQHTSCSVSAVRRQTSLICYVRTV